MANITKFLSEEITLTSANTVSSAKVVRLVNLDTSNSVVVTMANSTANLASFTLNKSGSDESVIYIAKEPTYTLQITGTAVVKAVSVAYL